MLNYKYKLIDICINRYEFQVVDNYNNRTGIHSEAVCDEDIKIFVAPLHKLVLSLMENLFEQMNKNKDIIKETGLSDSTVRRTLKNLLKKEKIVSESESINSPNRRYKMTE